MKPYLLFLILIIPQYLCAQQADTLDLGEFVITASKIPMLEKETTKPVTIIDAETISRSSGKSLAQLLNEQNGVMINGAYSSAGKDKSVYLRGAGTQYTLILIDGFPVSDPSSEGGAFDLRLIPLSNIERIEIVKGSMSTLYGSDAIAGVINIITHKPGEDAYQIDALASYGSNNSLGLMAGADGRSGILGYSVNVSHQQTDGISEAEASNDQTFGRDGLRQNNISLDLNLEVLEGLQFSPFIHAGDYKGDYDSGAFLDGDNTYKASLLNSGTRMKYSGDHLEIKGAYTYTKTNREFIESSSVFNPKATVQNTDIFATLGPWAPVRMLLGLNFQQLKFKLEGYDIAEGSDLFSPYATAYFESGFGLNVEMGLRLNLHSEYGSNWNYNISPIYSLTEEIRVSMSLSTGFKSPTLNELFGPFGANVHLKPQQSRSINIGLGYIAQNNGLNAEVNYFKRKIDDMIDYSAMGYINVNEQNDSGWEIRTGFEFNNTSIDGFYNYLTGSILDMGIETQNLIRRPKHSFGLNIDQRFSPRLSTSISAGYVGEREDIYFDSGTQRTVQLEDYFLVDIYAQLKLINEKLTLFIDLNNVLNTDFYEVYGFNTQGLHVNSGIRFHI